MSKRPKFRLDFVCFRLDCGPAKWYCAPIPQKPGWQRALRTEMPPPARMVKRRIRGYRRRGGVFSLPSRRHGGGRRAGISGLGGGARGDPERAPPGRGWRGSREGEGDVDSSRESGDEAATKGALRGVAVPPMRPAGRKSGRDAGWRDQRSARRGAAPPFQPRYAPQLGRMGNYPE